jgi:hypothetical protein
MNAGWLCDDNRTPSYPSFGLRNGYKLGYWIDCRQRLIDNAQLNFDC